MSKEDNELPVTAKTSFQTQITAEANKSQTFLIVIGLAGILLFTFSFFGFYLHFPETAAWFFFLGGVAIETYAGYLWRSSQKDVDNPQPRESMEIVASSEQMSFQGSPEAFNCPETRAFILSAMRTINDQRPLPLPDGKIQDSNLPPIKFSAEEAQKEQIEIEKRNKDRITNIKEIVSQLTRPKSEGEAKHKEEIEDKT